MFVCLFAALQTQTAATIDSMTATTTTTTATAANEAESASSTASGNASRRHSHGSQPPHWHALLSPPSVASSSLHHSQYRFVFATKVCRHAGRCVVSATDETSELMCLSLLSMCVVGVKAQFSECVVGASGREH